MRSAFRVFFFLKDLQIFTSAAKALFNSKQHCLQSWRVEQGNIDQTRCKHWDLAFFSIAALLSVIHVMRNGSLFAIEPKCLRYVAVGGRLPFAGCCCFTPNMNQANATFLKDIISLGHFLKINLLEVTQMHWQPLLVCICSNPLHLQHYCCSFPIWFAKSHECFRKYLAFLSSMFSPFQVEKGCWIKFDHYMQNVLGWNTSGV